MTDTIAAAATAPGVAAIGIVRLSGDRAVEIAGRLFRPFSGAAVAARAPRALIYGQVLDEHGDMTDTGLCSISRSPSSYTGEDTAEIQCHGSPVVLAEVLRAAFRHGARQAEAGEFTKRAFLNGRLDLTQAEAVIDVIEAESSAFAKNAAAQLAGAARGRAEAIYSDLLDIVAHFQAVIDYPDEDIGAFAALDYVSRLADAQAGLIRMCSTAERGRVLRDGARTAIIGRPNVGKSSLLNALVGYERAIVTAAPGTTRDTVEEKLRVGQLLLRLIDTAGIRESDDEAEKLGVARSISAARGADLAIAVFDGSAEFADGDAQIALTAKSARRRVAVINKSDLPQRLDASALDFDVIRNVSAKTGDGVDELAAAIEAAVSVGEITAPGEILTNARQFDAALRALSYVESALRAIAIGMTPDAALSDVEGALAALGEFTGRVLREDVVERIFARFCVGK